MKSHSAEAVYQLFVSKLTALPLEYVIIGWISVIIIGCFLGYNNKITVYRNYSDLGLCFLLFLAPFVVILSLASPYIGSLVSSLSESRQNLLLWFIVALLALLLIWILVRTAKDNPNPLFFIAIITKLTLAALFIFHFINMMSPGGKTASERASSRRRAVAILLLVAPLIAILVKDKSGKFILGSKLKGSGIKV